MALRFKTLRYELRPNLEQSRALARTAGARRFVFNWALERWRAHYVGMPNRFDPVVRLARFVTAVSDRSRSMRLTPTPASGPAKTYITRQ
jgi:transposase